MFARAIGLAWPLQLLAVAIWIAVPHPANAHPVVLVLITVAVLPMYVPLFLLSRPMMTRKAANAAMLIGSIQMSAMVWAGGGLASGFELLPLWFVPAVVCLVPRLDVIAQLLGDIAGAGLAAVIESHTAASQGADPMWGFAVVAVLTLTINAAGAIYVRDQLRSVSERFRRGSVEDALTGLANRPAIERYLADTAEDTRHGAAYVIDVDGFKFVNDSLGQRTGDQLLGLLAERLRCHARAGDLLARSGSDEFVLLAREISTPTDALLLAHRLLSVCEQPFALDDLDAHMSVSVGVALLRDGASAEESLRNADLALHAAKLEQPGTARLFESSMREQAVSQVTIEHHLRRALERHELSLVYQPVFALPAKKITGMEALLRWHSAELGEVSPAEFIPIAERTPLILTIGRFVLTEALTQLASWRRAGHDIEIAVNLSAGQLADEQLPDLLAALIAGHAIPAEKVCLELTETALMEHATSRPLATLDRLRATGARLALDDFGTGYSSLNRLSSLKLSAVKIDRSFVARMLNDPAASAIVSVVLRMSDPMGVLVIAEGVESEDQLSRLTQLGCQYAQGYLLARPLEPDAARQLLDYGAGPASRAA